MKHYGDDDLILYYYGEAHGQAEMDRHLDRCAACAASYRAIAATLSMVAEPPAPERGDRYGLEVWQRIRNRLPEQDVPWWMSLFRWDRLATAGLAAALAVLIVAAFVAGWMWPHGGLARPAPVQVAEMPGDADARARTAAISDHLERSERVLLELLNSQGAPVNVHDEQVWAADLVDANRLYRDAAVRAGDTMVAGVLDDLERSLLDIVHGPSTLSAADLERLRVRLDAAALLFKVRVLHDELRERESAPASLRKTI